MPQQKRAMGFAVQSILARLPAVVARPPLGGLLIAQMGLLGGVRWALGITAALAGLAVFLQRSYYVEAYRPTDRSVPVRSLNGQGESIHKNLK